MKRKKWDRLSKETIFSNPYYSLSHDRYVLPGGGTGSYHYIDISGSAMVVPILGPNKLVMARQHRYLMGRSSLEFPAGGMKGKMTPLETALEELGEEVGYEPMLCEKIGSFAPYNGVSNEMCHVYLATELIAVPPEPEITEEVEAVILSPAEVQSKILSGEIWDGMTIVSFHLFLAKQ